MLIETTALPKVLQSEAIVRFQDCDPFNHLNNARYIDYFLNAREDQVLRHYGLDIYGMAMTTGSGWVVGRSQLAYFKPAKLMEQVVIESQLIQYGNRDITVEMRMLDRNQTHLKAFMWANFVHFRIATGKSEHHAPELMEMFQSVVSPMEVASFDDRFMQLVGGNHRVAEA